MAFISRNAFTGAQLLKVPYQTQAVTSAMIDRLDARYHELKNSLPERKKELVAINEVLKANKKEICESYVRESGKAFWLADVEFGLTVNNFQYFIDNLESMNAPVPSPRTPLTPPNAKLMGHQLRPIGVIYQTNPFNFPLWISMSNATKNIAMGNTTLVRPDKGSVHLLTAYADQMTQNGVRAMEHGYTAESDLDFIMSNPRIAGVTFTGSSPVGTAVTACASKYLKKSLTELGGSDPAVVLDDADMDLAVKKVVEGRLLHSGQVCCGPKRILVNHKHLGDFEKKVVDLVQTYKTGQDPMEMTEQGKGFSPMSRTDLREKVADQVQRAVKSGDRLLSGGKMVGETFFEPTVMVCESDESPLWREEIFGPVVVMRGFDTEEKALEMANDTHYGLSSSVYSRDEERALNFARNIEAGTVHVNEHALNVDVWVAYGGNKASGLGRNKFSHFTNEQSYVVHDDKFVA